MKPKPSPTDSTLDHAPWLLRHGWIFLMLAPGLWALLARPVAPLDETRLLGVAWEMWQRGDFLVPYMNGETYSHKPPLVLWLVQAGWALFGVNDWWPRLVSPLVMLGATGVAARLAGELWPGDPMVRFRTAWLLAGTLGWMTISQMVLYDPVLTLCALLGLLGAWRAGRDGSTHGWLLLAAGIGFGILAKGPVILIHVLVPALLAPLWSDRARRGAWRWFAGVLIALLGGLLVAGAWAIPAALKGGDDYANAILFGQTAGRMVESFAHARPWWAYAVFLPLLLLPWLAMPMTWRAIRRARLDSGLRFTLAWLGGSLLAFSFVSAKQPHYIVPEIAAAIMLLAGTLSGVDGLGRLARWAAAFVFAFILLGTVAMHFIAPHLDVEPAARLAAELQARGVPVAVMHQYHHELAFPGRLEQPIPELQEGAQHEWFERHPDGVVITIRRSLPDVAGAEIFASFPHRRDTIDFWRLAGTGQAAH